MPHQAGSPLGGEGKVEPPPSFNAYLNFFKEGKIHWRETPFSVQREFIETAAVELKVDPMRFASQHFHKRIQVLGNKSLSGLFKHHRIKGESLTQTVERIKDTLHIISIPYVLSVEEAIALLKERRLFWKDVSSEVQRQLIEIAAKEIGRPSYAFTSTDFQKKIGYFNNISLEGMLNFYHREGESLTESVKRIKAAAEIGIPILKEMTAEEAIKCFREKAVSWRAIHLGSQRRLIEIGARELKLDPLELKSSFFEKRIKAFNNKTLGGLLGFYHKKGESYARTVERIKMDLH